MTEWAMHPALDFYLLIRSGTLREAVGEIISSIDDESKEAKRVRYDLYDTVDNYVKAYTYRKQRIDEFNFDNFGSLEGRQVRQALHREKSLLEEGLVSGEEQAEAYRRIDDLEVKAENAFLFGVNLLEAIYTEIVYTVVKKLETEFPEIAKVLPSPMVPDFFLAFSTKQDYVITESDYTFARRRIKQEHPALVLEYVQEKEGPRCRVYEPFCILLNASILPYKTRVWRILPERPDFVKVGGFISGKGYRQKYIEAYQKGAEYFRSNYTGELNALYGVNGKALAATIQKLYSENGKDGERGWNYVKYIGENNDWMNRPLGNALVEEVGYYTGIATECESFMKEHSGLFVEQHFTKNPDHSDKLTLEEIGLMYSYIDRYCMTAEEEADAIAQQFGHKSGKKLLEFFNRYCKGPNERIGDRESDRKNRKQQSRLENILPHLEKNYPEAYKRAQNEYHTFLTKL